jgi:hypothetical protein
MTVRPNFPMFLDAVRTEAVPILTYVDPGIGHLSDFTTHPDAYSGFLKRLRLFAFAYAGKRTAFFSKAGNSRPRTGQLSSQLARDFVLRGAWEAKRYETLTNSDLEFFNHAKQCFPGKPFESAYKKWQTGQISKKPLVPEIESPPSRARKKCNSRRACFLVTILPLGRTRMPLKNRAVNGFPHGFPFGFPHPPLPKCEESRKIRTPRPKTGCEQNRKKGGSDPIFSPGLRPEKQHGVAPALFNFVMLDVLARVLRA